MLMANIEAISNREDWTDQVQIFEDNEVVDITGATIVLAVREKTSKTNKLLAQTGDGVTIDDGANGLFSFSFPVASMRGMNASIAYEVGCTVELNGVTKQLFIGTVSVLDGIVP